MSGPHNEHSAASDYHVPVLLNETVEALNIQSSGTYVDCTFGGGGHSREILKHLGPDGRLFVFDQDADARKNLPDDNRVVFFQENFRFVKKFLRLQGCTQVDGLMADLGVSSHQFDEPERGFSIRFDADLDMRMDTRQSKKASDVLSGYTEHQLHKLFEMYGEVTNAKTLARMIVEQRSLHALKTISQLKESLKDIVKGNPNKYFAQVFQALRMEVNDEMGALRDLLNQLPGLMKERGRVAIISFHSIEDRMVKNFFKTGSTEAIEADEVFGTRPASPWKLVSKKPIEAGEKELKSNTRSRSAKLRVAERI